MESRGPDQSNRKSQYNEPEKILTRTPFGSVIHIHPTGQSVLHQVILHRFHDE
jgi:hypothetical protein